MKFIIKLKKDISTYLETSDEGIKHTDYLAPDESIIKELGKEIEVEMATVASMPTTATDTLSADAIEALKYMADSTLIFANSTDHLIHWKWVDKIAKEPLNVPNMQSSFIKVSKTYLLEKTTGKLINKADIKICTECGKPLDTHNEVYCKSCLTKKFFYVHNYSHKPKIVFHGNQKGTLAKTNPAWYGLELEYGLETQVEMAQLVYEHQSELFLKSDNSISGGSHRAEMVSHPGSFEHLMSPSSWVNKLDRLPAVDKPDSNGCHIHISRTAFKDDKHYAKFKYLIQENIPLVELIGGRKLNNFCSLLASKATMFKTKKEGTSGEKYAMCNEQHQDTIELRFMASSNKPKQVRRYIQFLDAMVKYTAYYGSSASYKGYFDYITKYQTMYPDIFALLNANQDKLTGEVAFKEPKLFEADIMDLPTRYYGSIVSAKMYGIDGFNDGEVREYGNNNKFTVEVGTDGNIRHAGGYSFRPTSKMLVTYAKI